MYRQSNTKLLLFTNWYKHYYYQQQHRIIIPSWLKKSTLSTILIISTTSWIIINKNDQVFPNNNSIITYCDPRHKTYSDRGDPGSFKRYFAVGKLLGEGTFAIVREAKDLETKEIVAVKEIDKSKSDEEARANEALVMERMGQHPNLVQLRHVYESPTVLYLVQDLADGGELFERIVKNGELSERTASKFFRDAVLGLRHLHERHIAHLDIKPENLLLMGKNKSAEHVVLADFGLAMYAGEGAKASQLDVCVGTPAYWSPEMIRREKFGLGVDVWALGCVLYILLLGVHPFDPSGESPEATILARAAKGDFDTSSSDWKALSPSAKDLIRHLLEPDPSLRYNTQQILSHPWLTDARNLPLPNNHLAKLRGYRVLSILKSGLSNMLISAKDDLFSSLDRDGDGKITKEELASGLAAFGVTKHESDAFFKLADVNQDMVISREEFDQVMAIRFDQELASTRAPSRLEDLETLFNAFDSDKDGYICEGDVAHVLSLLGGSHMNKSALTKELAVMDSDGDGRVSFAEFVRYIRSQEMEMASSPLNASKGGGGTNVGGGGSGSSSGEGSGTPTTVSGVHKVREKRDLLRSRR
jgi:calcium-dependent protein kinase